MSDGISDNPKDRLSPSEAALLIKVKSRVDELERQQAEEKTEAARQQKRQVLYNGLLTVFTGLLFVTSLVSDIVLIRQTQASIEGARAATSAANTAKDTLGASAKSFRQEQRAYLWASSFNMSNPPTCDYNGLRVCGDVHVTNSGRTPANGVQIHRYATFGAHAEQTIREMKVPPYTTPSGDMLGTTGDKWGTAPTGVIDQRTAQTLVNGSVSLYIYGVVQYFDIFSEYHETGFCRQRVLNNTPFIACTFGNWFDKRPGQK